MFKIAFQVINNTRKANGWGVQVSGGDTLSVHSGVSGSAGSHTTSSTSNLSKRSQLLMKKAAEKAQQVASKSNSIMR